MAPANISSNTAMVEQLGLADRIVDERALAASVARCRERKVVLPTFAQLADPRTIDAAVTNGVHKNAADARNLFSTLLGVSGIGPKIALACLAVYDAAALRGALSGGDVTALTRVPGIGKRGAERMVLELRDKIGAVPDAGVAMSASGHAVRGPVVEALVGLGFAVRQAEEACDKALADEPEAGTSSALRAALSLLGRK